MVRVLCQPSAPSQRNDSICGQRGAEIVRFETLATSHVDDCQDDEDFTMIPTDGNLTITTADNC